MVSESSHGGLRATLCVALLLCFFLSPANAETYRWTDENGKVHYGAIVPPEYADQPYDVLNEKGMVIKRIEPSKVPIEEEVKEVIKTKEPLISEEERQRQTDRLLVIQYKSEDEIQQALELELAQLGYDTKLINQTMTSTTNAIREQIRLAANQQRANLPLKDEQKAEIDKLYLRLERENQKLAAVNKRETRIRERFQAKLERYRYLTSKYRGGDEGQAEQADG